MVAHFTDKLHCTTYDTVAHPSRFVESGSNFQMKDHFAEHLFFLWNCCLVNRLPSALGVIYLDFHSLQNVGGKCLSAGGVPYASDLKTD